MEETLIIIKPDAMKKKLAGEIISRFEKEGLNIKEIKSTQLTKDFVKNFYSHLDKKLHPQMVSSIHDFMTSHPVIFAILEGENAVARVRKLCGPTDPMKAEKGTIRGDFSNDCMDERDKKREATQNAIHASGSVEEAIKEIEIIKKHINSMEKELKIEIRR